MKKKPLFLLVFFAAFYCGQLFAQFPQENISNKSFLAQYWNDIKNISYNSFSPQKYSNWKLLTYAGLTSLFILSNDLEFHEEYGLEKQYGAISLPRTLADIGNIYDKPGTL